MSKKKPCNAEKVSSKKTPVYREDPGSDLALHPSWQFSKADMEYKRWSVANAEDIEEILKKLQGLESQTWGEIRQQDNGCHTVQCNKFITEAKKRMAELKLTYEEMFSIRIDGKKRLYGVIEDGVFLMIWYDREHEIYPSKKKHT